MIAVLAAGCQGGEATTGKPGTAATTRTGPEATFLITPPNGASGARPDRGISVTARSGRLGTVQVTANGAAMQGELTADGTRWLSRWPLAPGRTYTVSVASTIDGGGDRGKVTTATARFSTAPAARTASASVTGVEDGGTVGVGMPIMINFSQPVYNKAEIERTLEVRASRPVEGAWRWFGDQQVIFRPKRYWPSGTRVALIAHLNGARPAKGVYATKDLRLRFTVGDQVISTVDTRRHTMKVRRNGKVLRTMPMSAGRGTERRFTTTNGVHVISEKVSPVIFDSTTVGIPKGDPNYYKIKGYWAARISDSGEYVHSAPWSVADQGKRNVSHGCVNLGPANAKWFYRLSHLGDIVIVTGTDRELEPGNGLGYWQLPWKKWLRGSELHKPITTTALPRQAG